MGKGILGLEGQHNRGTETSKAQLGLGDQEGDLAIGYMQGLVGGDVEKSLGPGGSSL